MVYVEPLPESGYRLGQVPAVSGALVALDPNDGAIVSLVGGFDFGSSKYNRVVQAQRQPGSAFKPFLYSAALERGFTPATLVNDAPIVLPGGGGAEGDEEWRPQNITRKFYGPTPMREGLVRSRNLVSIRLLRGAGIGFALQHIAKFGFGPQSLPANLTLALGTGQVTPLEMARGFAVFANGGALVTPYFIQSVQDSGGNELFQAEPARACGLCDFDAAGESAAAVAADLAAVPDDVPAIAERDRPATLRPRSAGDGEARAPQAISPANAFVMTDMMTDVIQRGTAQRAAAALKRKDIAGKTGTTSDRRDTWFVGFNADIAAAVWLGFDQERSLGENEEGGKTALPMWIYFMQEALRDKPEHRQPEPPGVVRMWVSRESGAPTRAGAPGALFETFLEQYAPQPGMGGFGDDGVGAETSSPLQETNPSSDVGSHDVNELRNARCRHGAIRYARRHMSRQRPNPRAEMLRQAVAEEAARVMAEQGIDDFLFAKRKAAARLGVVDASILPRNTEIEAALFARRRLFADDRHQDEIADLRRSALQAMRLMAEFDPRLVGPVLTGTASAHSDIHLHLFSESAEAVSIAARGTRRAARNARTPAPLRARPHGHLPGVPLRRGQAGRSTRWSSRWTASGSRPAVRSMASRCGARPQPRSQRWCDARARLLREGDEAVAGGRSGIHSASAERQTRARE